MARSTPTVTKGILVIYEAECVLEIVVESRAWFEWLERESSTLFTFHMLEGSYTARKERSGSGRGGWYWKAYRKHQGKLYRVYIGKIEDLTLSRLKEIEQMFLARIADKGKTIKESPEVADLAEKEEGLKLLSTPLLETRLRPPRLPAQLVERPHLTALLDSGRQHRLTLLHAPAGFGKTTLVNQWLRHRQPQVSTFIAWLSLESNDNDPLRFWSALIAACQVSEERMGQTALEHLTRSARQPFAQLSWQTGLTFLLNDLSHLAGEGIVILEDYHWIKQVQIHEMLIFFIEHLPATFHVVILTRSLPPFPLVRWNMHGDLLQIQASQLRFSKEETALFFQQMFPQMPAEESLRTLYEQLEGWAAGLRLLALSQQGQMKPWLIEKAFRQPGLDVETGRTYRPIQEFFLSEVLASQPEPLQLFLLQTSLLSRLSFSLCNALTGRQDSATWLAMVEHSGIFLEALDSVGEWYRYHPLFAEAMQVEATRRLGIEKLRELSALASYWYEEHSMLTEAIEAALSAHDFQRAGLLIENLNRHVYFNEYHTMRRWLEQIPHNFLVTHPVLCFLLAQARIFTERQPDGIWRIESAEDLLQLAEKGWREQKDYFQIGILYAFRATFTIIHGLVEAAVAYAQQALPLLPTSIGQLYQQRPSEWIEWHCGCLLALGMKAMQIGDFVSARQYLLTGFTFSLHVKDRVFTRVIERMLGDVALGMGELHQANSYYQQALSEPSWPDENGEQIFRTQLACGLIRLAYERNELDRVEQLLREVDYEHYQGDFPAGEEVSHTQLELLRFQLLNARGKKVEALALLSSLVVHLQSSRQTGYLIPDILLYQARMQIRDGALQAAEQTLDALVNFEQAYTPLQQCSLHLLTARLYLARGKAESALSLLEQLLNAAQKGQHVVAMLEIQVLIALAYASLEQKLQSHQHLTSVLAQAYNEGFLRLFLDEGEPLAALIREMQPFLTEKSLHAFAQSILYAFSYPFASPTKKPNNQLLEPLSAQEQRILTFLVAGHSNREIAAELIVSVNTVKGHVKNIYRKLDVNNRVQAGMVARRLELI